MRSLLHVAIAAAALLLALPAVANTLDQAKASGHLGEQADGYLGLPPGAPKSAASLRDKINGERRLRYDAIAKKNSTTPAAVAALAGKKLIERTPPGQWVRGPGGGWARK